ncbi:MAG TPA: hypothetical protein VEA16_21945 [Vicinamibacterales bacterium]|nr:hypothetical protein [Vicinamibacterales bacterium]
MKLVFAVPSYGPMDPAAVISQRNAIMHAAANGVTWLGDASPDRMKFDAARNAVVKAVLDSPDAAGADAIFWCDSDVVLPSHAITSLVAAGKDFVTGIYFQRRAPFWPLIAHFNPKAGPDKTGAFNWFTDWPTDVVAPIDGCGFGCVLTSTRMLRAMGSGPWFTFEKYSEDFDFCLRAARAGFQPYVHTGVLCGHLADPVPVTHQHFRQAWEQEQRDGPIRSQPA